MTICTAMSSPNDTWYTFYTLIDHFLFCLFFHFYLFSMQKMHNEALLSLMQTLEGPQDIELELSMTVFKDGQPAGTNVAKLYIIVSEYTF